MLFGIEILFGESHGRSKAKVIWSMPAGKNLEAPVSMELSVRHYLEICAV